MATIIREAAAEPLADRYTAVRAFTEALCEPLETEDYVVQSMDDVSPAKWHLAHTSWFFETFVLRPHLRAYREYDPAYAFLFNSYYTQAGERHCRAQRGYISRPTVAEVFAYRQHVDAAMAALLSDADAAQLAAMHDLIELGLNHEQQHQELMLTDIKHVFSVNPLRPAYRAADATSAASGGPRAAAGGALAQEQEAAARAAQRAAAGGATSRIRRWHEYEGGVHEIGHAGAGFAYDNEAPRHRVYLEPFALADRLVTNGEYLAFMQDGGYRRPELWLSLGWATVEEQRWSEPFYWEQRDGEWWLFTLSGMRRVAADEPVVHLSYFEADAFARWAGARLPTEAEWEVAAARTAADGNFVDSGALHPRPAADSEVHVPRQLYGDVWEWTQSPYSAYPGYRPAAGAIGEYNGKFMCNQFVLRGGSCATSRSHMRATYRNFFPPDATWQFSGLRLARDV